MIIIFIIKFHIDLYIQTYYIQLGNQL